MIRTEQRTQLMMPGAPLLQCMVSESLSGQCAGCRRPVGMLGIKAHVGQDMELRCGNCCAICRTDVLRTSASREPPRDQPPPEKTAGSGRGAGNVASWRTLVSVPNSLLVDARTTLSPEARSKLLKARDTWSEGNPMRVYSLGYMLEKWGIE